MADRDSLSPSDTNLITQSTSSSLRSFYQNIDFNELVSNSNPYKNNASFKIGKAIDRKTVIDSRHLAEIIASSHIIHCIDGWSYLGRAIETLLSGDKLKAIHFAYYAQLRAALSLLASHGIGVFSKHKFFIDSSFQCHYFECKMGTHNFLWKALKVLFNETNIFFDAISPSIFLDSTMNLNILLNNTRVLNRPLIKLISAATIKHLIIDLQDLGFDQVARNYCSYDSASYFENKNPNASDLSNFLSDFWKFSEPAIRPFVNLDEKIANGVILFLLRSLSRTNTGNKIIRSLKNANYSNLTARSRDFDKFYDLVRIKVFPGKFKPDSAFHVLMRSLILLRYSTASCQTIFTGLGIDTSQIKPFSDKIAETFDLWESSFQDDIFTLYKDIELGLEEMNETIIEKSGWAPNRCNYNWRKLGNTELMGIWALSS